jgi:hypothetical protein
MRKIDWEKPLSPEDIAFLRQAGIPGMMERVEVHQAQFDAEVPEVKVPEDTLTQSALDPQGRVANQVPEFDQLGAPQLVDPTKPSAEPDVVDEGDDYDQWKVPELEAEVKARNELEGTSEVTVTGTGTNGNITKPDLVKGLRLWDQENPDAL